MSEVKLNLVDAEKILSGTVHGSIADRCIAALSAEPETISELEAALERFIKRVDGSHSHFPCFRSVPLPAVPLADDKSFNHGCIAVDSVPWDAGLVIIDLAARIVVCHSSYSQPGYEGEIFYHDGHALTDSPILYRVPGDWLFVNSVEAYQWSRPRHLRMRQEKPAFDARPILFGQPLLQFIVNAYLALPIQTGPLSL
jgi:hypothetical protein